MKTPVLLVLALATSAAFASDAPYTWKNSGVSSYSDTPPNLQVENIGIMNVKTQSVTPIAQPKSEDSYEGLSLTEKQAKLNEEFAEANRKIEEENKKRLEAINAENCSTAQANLRNVQTATRIENREAMISRYQSDVSKYCK